MRYYKITINHSQQSQSLTEDSRTTDLTD